CLTYPLYHSLRLSLSEEVFLLSSPPSTAGSLEALNHLVASLGRQLLFLFCLTDRKNQSEGGHTPFSGTEGVLAHKLHCTRAVTLFPLKSTLLSDTFSLPLLPLHCICT